MFKLVFRRTLSAALVAGLLSVTSGAWAVTPATGLGQAWPNAADVSANPNWHVYVFTLNGVRYVQINDLQGRIIGAVGTAGGQFITLPVGTYSQLVTTPQQPAAATTATPTASPTTVYNDGVTQLTTTPMSDGSVTTQASSSQQTCDPVDCNIKGVKGQ